MVGERDRGWGSTIMGHALWTVHALWNVWTVVMAAMHSPATSTSGDHLKEYKNGSQQKYSFDEPNAMKVDSAMSFFQQGNGRVQWRLYLERRTGERACMHAFTLSRSQSESIVQALQTCHPLRTFLLLQRRLLLTFF